MQKYFTSRFGRNSFTDSPVPPRQEGRMRYRHETWGGMRWTRVTHETSALSRTAKSCGPDAPTLASSRWDDPLTMVATKPGSPGRARRKPLKPLRGEGRIVRLTCGDYARVLFSFAREATGALSTPAFPAPSVWGDLVPGKPRAHRATGRRRCVRSLLSFRGDVTHRTRTLEIPGLIARTIPE